jgi:hypothetical protein
MSGHVGQQQILIYSQTTKLLEIWKENFRTEQKESEKV